MRCILGLLLGFGLSLCGLAEGTAQESEPLEQPVAVENDSASGGDAELVPDEELLEREAADVAMEAAEVRDQYCSDLAGGSTTLAAQTLTVVGEVWARVSDLYERSEAAYLIYWRGVLGQCLSQDRRAEADLKAFVQGYENDPLWPSLVKDAKRRLRVLKGAGRDSDDAVARLKTRNRVVTGVVFSVLSVSAGVASGLFWSEAQQVLELSVYPLNGHGEEDTPVFDEFLEEAQALSIGGYALLGASIGMGIGATLAFVSAGLAATGVEESSLLLPLVAPMEGGLALSVHGRW